VPRLDVPWLGVTGGAGCAPTPIVTVAGALEFVPSEASKVKLSGPA
jgi:hypothetical protein